MNQNEVVGDMDEAVKKCDLDAAMGLAAALDEHQLCTMIKKVLEEWKNISLECRGKFKEAIKLTKKKTGLLAIPGFKDPEKALEQCPMKLEKPLLQTLRSLSPASPLSAIIIALWQEAHQKLYDAVLRFLQADESRPAVLTQAKRNSPRGCPKTTQWTNVRKDFADSQDVEFPLEHVDLMFCYVTHLHFSNQVEEDDSLPLGDWINSLKSLPYDDPLWRGRFDFFCQQIKKIGKSKHAAQSVVVSLKNTLAEVERKFADDLAFLQLKIPSVTQETIASDFDSARKHADHLKKALERFSSLRQERKEAKTYAQEQPFLKKLPEAAKRVSEAHSELEKMLAQQAPPTKNLSARSAPLQPEQENERMEAKELRQQMQNLRETSKTDKRQIEQLRQQIEKLQKIATANKEHKEEIKKLRASRDTSRESEKLWRETYQNEMRRKSAVGADGQKADGKVRSVQEAFEKAERDYPEELVVKLNNHSNLKKNRFEKPDEVLKALQWLALFYRKARMNGASTSNLDESLRQTCSNWFYSANQSEFALREFPGWYTTIVNNKTYELEPHIGTSTSRNERHTIRIAFGWDPELKKVVVGFVGQHQRTPKKA